MNTESKMLQLLKGFDYLGHTEFAFVVGMSPTHLGNRRRAGTIPPPDYELAMGAMWTSETVERWIKKRMAKKKK